MSSLLEKSLELARNARSLAKELAMEIPKATSDNNNNLHEKALNMLLLSSQIETTLQSLLDRDSNMTQLLPSQKAVISNEEAGAAEVVKLHKKLPRWAKNPSQINSQILSSYLRLASKYDEVVTEELLREEFVSSGGNADQFNKNFPQMKIIAERNHGKVFDVINGKITIWPPARPAVDEFREISTRES